MWASVFRYAVSWSVIISHGIAVVSLFSNPMAQH